MRDNVKGGALTEVTFFILLAAFVPRHGYGIMQFIEEKTDGRLSLGAGTLYGALQSLHEKGWIVPLDSGNNGRRKAYGITPLGRKIAQAELGRLRDLAKIASEIIGDEHNG